MSNATHAPAVLRLSRSAGDYRDTRLSPFDIDFSALCEVLSKASVGPKEGDYFVRGPCLPTRADGNLPFADVVIIDGDKRINPDTGEIEDTGAPHPSLAHEALREMDISHVIYTSHSHSHSHSPGRFRWRAVIPCHCADQETLRAVVDWLIDQLHKAGVFVANARENGNWSQPWYFPRLQSAESEFLAYSHEGDDPLTTEQVGEILAAWRKAREGTAPPFTASSHRASAYDSTTPIGRFIAAHDSPECIGGLLEKHGYVFRHHATTNGRPAYRFTWPGTTSGIPGVHLFSGQGNGRWLTFSHHPDDPLHGKVRDAFGLFQLLEHGDDQSKAVAAAAEWARHEEQEGDATNAADRLADWCQALRAIAALDPVHAELHKPALAASFNVSPFAVDKALGHITRALRPSFPLPPDPTSLAIRPLERMAARLAPDCIVADYLYADVALLSAAGGTGKTTLILFEAIHIVLGRPLHGLAVKRPGPVAIITAEDSREILLGRVQKIMQAMELTMEEQHAVDNGLLIWDVSGELSRLVEIDASGNLTLTGLSDAIVEALQPVRPALVVVDPIVSFGPGESRINDAEQMLILAARRLVRGLNCCVRYVTHVSQNAANSASRSQYASRGGTALPDGSRMAAVLNQWRPDRDGKPPLTLEYGPGEQVLILSRPKLSYAPPQEDLWLARRERGWLFTYAKPIRAPDADATRRANCDQVENFLVSELQDGRRYTQSQLERGKFIDGMTRDDLRAALAELAVSCRISPMPLPKDEQRTRRVDYLHPIKRVPIARDDDRAIDEKSAKKEAA